MHRRSQPHLLARAGSALLLVAVAGLCGLMMGGLWIRLFPSTSGMGWDQLADALGALMLGDTIVEGRATVQGNWLVERPAMLALAEAVGALGDRRCASAPAAP